MGSSRQVFNDALMSATNYKSKKSIQSVIRSLLRLEGLSERGDTVAASIMIDMKRALGIYGGKFFDILTPKQRVVIVDALIKDIPQREIAERLGLTQQAVSYLIGSGISRVAKFLETGKIKYRPFTDEEREYLLANYKSASIQDISYRLQRSENNCRVTYHNLINGGGRDDGSRD